MNSFNTDGQSANPLFAHHQANGLWFAMPKAVGCTRERPRHHIPGLDLLASNPKIAEAARRISIVALLIFAIICGPLNPSVSAQSNSSGQSASASAHGTVRDPAGKIVTGAIVHLEQNGVSRAETVVNVAGEFKFSGLATGVYVLTAEKAGLRSQAATLTINSLHDQQVDLKLEDTRTAGVKSANPPAAAMEFADNPSFAVSGVTDWTAAGGHGSDTSLRASEALTRETLTLKPGPAGQGAATASTEVAKDTEAKLRAALSSAPGNFDANHRLGEFYLQQGRYSESASLLKTAYEIKPGDFDNEYDLAQACENVGDLPQARSHLQHLLSKHDAANLHRLAGSIDEKLGDPLTAVHEYEQAVRMDPSEQNYFEWGSELLYHRAIWQSRAVFEQGVKAYPKSVRMLTALGAALFAGALYDDAAHRLCEASDLNPSDPEPYSFMGKIEIVAPSPLACVRQKLDRFLQLQPDNALANYFDAMALWKENGRLTDRQTQHQIEAMLTKAINADPKLAEGYLQLGNLEALRNEYPKAIGLYAKAIEVNPQLSEAHYRLGVAYERTGEKEKAKLEFEKHDEIEKQTAAEIQRQRKDVKQFVIALPKAVSPSAPPD